MAQRGATTYGATAAPGGRLAIKWAELPRTRRRQLIGAGLAAVLILCAWRLLTFIPQPLDAPGTLRPVFYALVTKLIKLYGGPERAEQSWQSLSIMVLCLPTVLAFLNYFSQQSDSALPGWVRQLSGSRLLFFGGIAGGLLLCRFPSMLWGPMNPDEGLFLVAAQKLFRDPIFFRTVDCGTSGPLNVYPMMLPALFGISPDYLSARLISVMIVAASVYCIYRTFALVVDEKTARIAVIPAAGVFAVVKDRDFYHYSSEDVSLLLLALALNIAVRTFRKPERYQWKVTGLGLLTGAAFFAKMQAVPIAGCISMVAILYIYRNSQVQKWWRPLLLFGAGAGSLFALNAVVCAASGVWRDFWMEYIVGNYSYARPHGSLDTQVSRFTEFVLSVNEFRLFAVTLLGIFASYAYKATRREALSGQALFLRMAVAGGIVLAGGAAFLQPGGSGVAVSVEVIGVALLPGAFLLLWQDGDRESAPIRWYGFLTAAVLVAALGAVFIARHTFQHYLRLVFFPLTTAMAWPVVAGSRKAPAQAADQVEFSGGERSGLAFLLIFATFALLRLVSVWGGPNNFGFARFPSTVRPAQSDLIDSITQPADAIAVWGWDAPTYLGAGRVPATKDIATAQLFVLDDSVRAYYREAYARALRRARPKLFVDAIDTSFPKMRRDVRDFELVPEVHEFIQSEYVHFLDAFNQRYYIRRDLAGSVAGLRGPGAGTSAGEKR